MKLVESTLKEHTIIFCLVQAFLSQGNNTSIFTELLSPNSQLINSNILEYYYLTQYPVNSGLVSLCNTEIAVFTLVLQYTTTKVQCLAFSLLLYKYKNITPYIYVEFLFSFFLYSQPRNKFSHPVAIYNN